MTRSKQRMCSVTHYVPIWQGPSTVARCVVGFPGEVLELRQVGHRHVCWAQVTTVLLGDIINTQLLQACGPQERG